ncbi:KN motif and ankyrin repeat domains 1-like isoform X2 [Pyxicephalus adspersus]|uniref:KN motif and ankyrin repeat domains 1-like isoform X2 n=2 Tax=Pyxicephalus adspersus TaxID=30357 RepID=UPI003B5CEB5E
MVKFCNVFSCAQDTTGNETLPEDSCSQWKILSYSTSYHQDRENKFLPDSVSSHCRTKMTQSININNNLPDLGAPFLYWDRNESDKTSYCVETPYGFQLDLDFLKYVDDIQSGQTLKKMSLSRKPRSSRRSTSSLRSLSSQTGISVSTESLDYSEDGTLSDSVFFTRDETRDVSYFGAKEALGLRKSTPITPTPLFKLLPPPTAKSKSFLNASVEKTLAEARKKQEQLNVDYEKIQSSNLSKLSVASRSSPNLTHGTLSTLQYNKIGDRRAVLSPTSTGSMKFSPVNSGRNTPADNSSTHLQYIREQMAASLKQLKDLEEQVKVIPVLQKQIHTLEREKRHLTDEVEKYKSYAIGMSPNTNSSLHEIDLKKKLDVISEHDLKLERETSRSEIKLESGISKPSKITELKRLTEKLSDTERKMSNEKVTTDKTLVRYPAVKEKSRKSVAVGEDIPMTDSVFYCGSQHENRDFAVQCSVETKDVCVWVMEPLLGLTSEAEKEIQILEHTIEHQRAVIKILENNLRAACDEMEELRVAVSTRTVIGVQSIPVETSAEANASMVNKPPEEYLQMVDARNRNGGLKGALEMSENDISSHIEINRIRHLEDSTFVDRVVEYKEKGISAHSERQPIPSSNEFDNTSVLVSEHGLTILGRDDADGANNKDNNEYEISEKDMKDGEAGATGALAGEKDTLMHLQSSDEVIENNDDEETEGSRTLKSLDEVIMSCAQVLAI